MSLELVLAKFPNAKRKSWGWSDHCPAHDDRHPSLSIREMDDGWTALNCFTGCSRDSILAAAGLTVSEIAPNGSAPRSRRSGVTDDELHELKCYVGGCQRLLAGESAVASEALALLSRRFGIGREQAIELGLGVDSGLRGLTRPRFLRNMGGDSRLIIPFHDADGRLLGVQGRALDERVTLRWCSPPGEGWATWGCFGLNRNTTVIVTEGPGDALAAYATGLAVAFVRGAGLDLDSQLLAELPGREVIVATDCDDGGEAAGDRWVAQILADGVPQQVFRLRVPHEYEDLAAWCEALGVDAFTEALGQHELEICELPPNPVTPPTPSRNEAPWPNLDDAALYGLAGDVVRTNDPHTEADKAGVLVSFLTGFGNLVGSGPHAFAGSVKHPGRLHAVLVGRTSRARKGTSWAGVRPILTEADPGWTCRIVGGFGSGEAVVEEVRDKSDGDEGERDKRLLIYESEYARILRVASKEGSTLSPIKRNAWDGDDLQVRTRTLGVLRATGAHISALAHITPDELRRLLSDLESVNGFANRDLFVCVERSKKLPDGGNLDPAEIKRLVKRVQELLPGARQTGCMRRSAEADELWREIYIELPDPPGIFGAITARAEAQMLRLSVIYALLDGSKVIDVAHLEAAWAVWRYCEASAAHIFGDATGDAVADRLLRALRAAHPAGLDFTAQHALFSNKKEAPRLEHARDLLERSGLARTTQEQTDGRPRSVTCAIMPAKQGK